MKRKFQVRFGEGRSEKQAKLLAGRLLYTTVVVNLGHACALLGRNTIIIDADPRGDASSALGLPAAPGIYQHLILGHAFASQAVPADRPATAQTDAILRPHLAILRGDQSTRRTASILHDEIVSREKPAEYIPAAWVQTASLADVDFIFIDTPPNGGFWPEQNYRAADLIIIPTSMDNIEKNAAVATHTKIREMGITAPVYIQPSIFVSTESVDQLNLESLKKTFGAEYVLPPIPRAAAIKQCRATGQTIFECKPKSTPAKAFQNLAQWLIAL